MYKGKKISITIPVFNESKFIRTVIESIPDYVDYIIVVDDASTDQTLNILQSLDDTRLHIIVHDKNEGVGKSTIDGHLKAIELGSDILVRGDGDGQMDMTLISKLIEPLINANFDFSKGNRFASRAASKSMPKFRKFGNRILTWMTRLSTGYNNLMDAQNGFTAIKRETFQKLRLDRLQNDYLFENSLLFELSLCDAKIFEVEMEAIYGNEKSDIKYLRFILKMLCYQFLALIKRIQFKAFRKRKKSN